MYISSMRYVYLSGITKEELKIKLDNNEIKTKDIRGVTMLIIDHIPVKAKKKKKPKKRR